MTEHGGVTIAIPNWNHEILLPRSILSALRSVALLRSRGVPGEVIVLDDFSRDGSPTLLRQLEALYYGDGLRVVSFAANAGLVASRNEALRVARHRFIAFLDADNELIPENLPTLLDALDHTGAAAAYGNLLVRTPSADLAHTVLNNESVQGKLFDANYIDAFAVFDRDQVVDAGGYETSCPTWEDYELWLHLATNGRKVVFVPVALGYYYALPSSMSQEFDRHKALSDRIRRIYNQMGVRDRQALNTRHAKYHPAVGDL